MWCETTGSTQGRVPKDCGFLKYIMVSFMNILCFSFFFVAIFNHFFIDLFSMQGVAKYESVHNVKRHFVMPLQKLLFLVNFSQLYKDYFYHTIFFSSLFGGKNSYFPKGRLLLKYHCIEFSHFLLGGVDKFSGNDNLSQ